MKGYLFDFLIQFSLLANFWIKDIIKKYRGTVGLSITNNSGLWSLIVINSFAIFRLRNKSRPQIKIKTICGTTQRVKKGQGKLNPEAVLEVMLFYL